MPEDIKFEELYKKFLDIRRDTDVKALNALIKEVIEQERSSTQVTNKKRRLISEMYPHLSKICDGDISILTDSVKRVILFSRQHN